MDEKGIYTEGSYFFLLFNHYNVISDNRRLVDY
jgi:hypothetical protein